MLEQAIKIISLVISFAALGLSIFTFQRARSSAVITFFTQGDGAEMKKSRRVIYEIYNEELNEDSILDKLKEKSIDVSNVVSFYDFWALMVKKHYLPMWTFQDSAKYTAKNVYNKIHPYIVYRRIELPQYASHFEWLIKKLG